MRIKNLKGVILVSVLVITLVLPSSYSSLIDIINQEYSANITVPVINDSGWLAPEAYGCFKQEGKWYCPEPKEVEGAVPIRFSSDVYCLSDNTSAAQCTPDNCWKYMNYGCSAQIEVLKNTPVEECWKVINSKGEYEGVKCDNIEWNKGYILAPFISPTSINLYNCKKTIENDSFYFECPFKGKEANAYFTTAGNSDYPTLMLWEEKGLIDYTTIIIIAIGMVLLGAFYYFNKKKKRRGKSKKRRYA